MSSADRIEVAEDSPPKTQASLIDVEVPEAAAAASTSSASVGVAAPPTLTTTSTVKPRQTRPLVTPQRRTPLNPRTYSVSFQENGFICQESEGHACGNQNQVQVVDFLSGRDVAAGAEVGVAVNIPPQQVNPQHHCRSCCCYNTRNTRSLGAQRNYNSMTTGDASEMIPGSAVAVTVSSSPLTHKVDTARSSCCDKLENQGGVGGSGRDGNKNASVDIDNDGEQRPLLGPQRSVNSTASGELHCHTGRAINGMDKKARCKLITASILCIIFIVIEVIGGVVANSLAIATDAAHLLSDFASFMISLFSLWVASRPATRNMSFGWHRAEVIGATVSVLLIWVVTGILVYMAVQRVINEDYEINALVMLGTSGMAVLFNILMGATLHQSGHSHGGGSSHSHTAGEGGDTNINVKAAFIHVVGDLIQSLGVCVAAVIIYFRPDLVIVDPICTFIFSVLVLLTTLRILKDTVNVLMEGLPKDINFDIVKETFLSVEGIVAIHNLRIWGITTDKIAMAAHLAIKPGVDAQTILKEATLRIRAKYNFFEMTLQVEDFQDGMHICDQCQNPE